MQHLQISVFKTYQNKDEKVTHASFSMTLTLNVLSFQGQIRPFWPSMWYFWPLSVLFYPFWEISWYIIAFCSLISDLFGKDKRIVIKTFFFGMTTTKILKGLFQGGTAQSFAGCHQSILIGDWKLLFTFYGNLDQNTIRAIPFEILTGNAEWKNSSTPPYLYFLPTPPPPHTHTEPPTTEPPTIFSHSTPPPSGSQMELT